MRKFFAFIISAGLVIFSICVILYKNNNSRDDIGILKEIQRISDIPVAIDILNEINIRTDNQKMMLDMLFYEVESDALNYWSNSLFYYEHTAETNGQGIYFFNKGNGPNLIGIMQNKKIKKTDKLYQAVYTTNGFTGCEIGKSSIKSIYSRFGNPDEKEFDTKYVYYKDKKSITFFFKDGILKNIMLTL